MHFLPAFVSALSCLSFATQVFSSPHKANPAPLSKTLIMKQTMDYTQGALPIYGPDGTIVYSFMRNIHDPVTGYTTVVLMNPTSEPLFVLRSSNNLCAHKTTYTGSAVSGSRKQQFNIDPNGLLKDHWSFSYVDSTGTQQNYKFARHYASKEGEIYHENGDLVAELRNQKRTDSWITTPSVHEVDTYTLSYAQDSPAVELALLMGLVMSRVHDCGI
ncbi:hypothetical protein PGT21_022377 [Puccinia graminis f. sp. tritici]|uniref:Uncharacterized protein n=1 Tax=Puccinia graminis f. sp. tritici TaxID=56615 RepID=A0A5B0MT15_PUCGR|nr:hypothetical protein PGT21_022377 [Puccinia graminis f. sp. tritici]